MYHFNIFFKNLKFNLQYSTYIWSQIHIKTYAIIQILNLWTIFFLSLLQFVLLWETKNYQKEVLSLFRTLTLISPAWDCYLIAPACVYFLLHSFVWPSCYTSVSFVLHKMYESERRKKNAESPATLCLIFIYLY